MKEFFVFLPLTVIYLALKSTLFVNVPLPDIAVIMVFYIAYRKASVEAAAFAFVVGYVDDAFSGGVIGLSAFSLVLVFIAVHLSAKKVHFSTPAMRAASAGALTLFKGVLIYMVLRFMDFEVNFLSSVVLQAVVTGVFAPAIITLLTRLTALLTPHSFKDDAN